MENGSVKTKGTVKRSPEELFNKFIEVEDCPEILQTFQRLVNSIGIVAETPREFYQNLKSKLQTWKCKSLWELLDVRANQKEYSKGTICEDIHVLVIGCGPIGLRTAIELALLGAQVVIVEKRKTFSRNNVLHLWPFLLTDFRSLGAKKFYGKFCSGSIDHISIRRLQAILLKTALSLGVKVFTGVTFEKVIEPPNEDEGWKCHVTPFHDSLTDYEVDVIIGADGKKNVLPGFTQIEMRGTLAIGITANFVNHFSEEDAMVEEISGIAYQFNPAFFDKLKQQKAIQLENIVYYKDETHYFVMTAVKSSLLKRGVLKKDYGNKPLKLLSRENVDNEKLVSYVHDAVSYATKGYLNNPELKRDDKNNADIAVFDFTSIKKAENSARIMERHGHKLLLGLVGDSLLEPFWPTGSGCARGVLSALDAAWMVRAFAQDKPPLQILSERENIYRLLSGTGKENMHKNLAGYNINPSSRYLHIPQKRIQEVYHLYDTDDPVNADFSLGSPAGILASKGSRKKRISTAAKPQYRHHRKHIKFAAQPTFDSPMYSSAGSSMEDLTPQGTSNNSKIDNPKARQRLRTFSEGMTSGGEEIHEIIKDSKWGKRAKIARSPFSPISHDNKTNMAKMSASGQGSGGKVRTKKQKVDRTVSSPSTSGNMHQEKAHKRRSFFGFGRARTKSRTGKKSPSKISDKHKGNVVVEEKMVSTVESKIATSNGEFFSTDELTKREINAFSRNHPMRRSTRDIIAEIEARNNSESTATSRTERKHPAMNFRDHSLEEKPTNPDHKSNVKRTTSDSDMYHTPPSKQFKTEDLWTELERLSPCAKGAIPALSNMSLEHQKENDPDKAHNLHNISSAMRIAGLMAIATPLLINEQRLQGSTNKGIPWYSRKVGRVKDTISKYDSLNGRRMTSNDGTPLRTTNDRVDNADRKPTLAEIAQRILLQQKATKKDEADNGNTREQTMSWQPTAIAFVEGKSEPSIIKDQAMAMSRQQEMEKIRFLEQFSSLDQESTDSPVKKDFSSPIYQKTFIAALKNNGSVTEKDSGKIDTPKQQLSLPRNYAQEGECWNSPNLAKKEMERLMQNLTETVSKERAEASIRFLISMFRRIQRNPKEDKFRRIFKSRVKFKKHVWTVRNAKLFMFASGWIEVGSFLLFAVEKNVREPLSILNKHLGLLVSGSSVQISTIKSTPRRGPKTETPTTFPSRIGLTSLSQEELATSLQKSRRSSKKETPLDTKAQRTPKSLSSKTDSTTGLTQDGQATPLRQAGTRFSKKETSLDKRFSRSVPQNLNADDWDLEMEDPLEQISVNHSDKKSNTIPRRMVSSALEIRTPRTATTPDIAIIEEIDELSNTLDNLIESLEDMDPDTDDEKKVLQKRHSPKEVKDLCTTLDYMLDSSEEEELDKDLKSFGMETNVSKDSTSPYVKTSAFTRVLTPKKRRQPRLQTTKNLVDGEDSVKEEEVTKTNGSDNLNDLGRKMKDPLETQNSQPNSVYHQNKTETKQTSRRKLPKQPDTKEISQKEYSKPSRLTASKSLDQTKPVKKQSASGRSVEKLHRQISKESLSIIQRRFGSENNISSSTKSKGIRENPFSLPKTKEKSGSNRSISESENQSSSQKNNSKHLIKKAQSEMNVLKNTKMIHTSSFSKTTDKSHQTQNNLKSSQMKTKGSQALTKSQSYDSVAAFKKPDVPKARKFSENSKASLSRECSNTESMSSLDSVNINDRPPSGLERSRSARARRRQEITSKLVCLETSYDTLEHSPKKSSRRTGSTSSSASTSSKISSVATEPGQQRSSRSLPRNSGTTKKPSSRVSSQSSITGLESRGNGKDVKDGVRTRSQSAVERKKVDGLLRKEDQEAVSARSKTNSLDKTGINQNQRKPLRRSNAMDTSTGPRASASGSERGSIKTKRRKLPSTNSATMSTTANRNELDKTSKAHEDNGKAKKDRKKDTTKSESEKSSNRDRPPSCDSDAAVNDSFDSITVPERTVLENVVDVDLNLKREFKSTVNVVDKLGNSEVHAENHLVSKATHNEDLRETDMASRKDTDVEDSKDNIENDDGSKVELKLQNTGSWMVLDYEGRNKTPLSTRKNDTPGSNTEKQSTLVEHVDKEVSTKDDARSKGKKVVEDAKEVMESGNNFDADNTAKATEKVLENVVGLGKNDARNKGKKVGGDANAMESGGHIDSDITVKVTGKMLENGVGHVDGNSNIAHQDVIVKPQANGTAAAMNNDLEGNDIIRRKAFRKPKKATKGLQKPSKTKSQSMDNLSEGKRNITFAKEQHVIIETSKVERSSKETKHRSHKPFGLRRKNIGESCPDINKSPHLETVSPVISSTLDTSTSSLDRSIDGKTSLNKSRDKKKLSPYKLLARRKKSPEISSLKNT